MTSIAHIRECDNCIQTVEEHLLQVKALAERYGEKVGVKHLTGLAGMLHDLGKYAPQFKNYILAAVNPVTKTSPKRGSVDHSTAGGKLLYELFHSTRLDPYKGIVAEVVGNAIISHHSYLHDFLTPELESAYLKRVRDKKCPELDEFESIKRSFFAQVMSETDFHLYVDKAAAELEQFLTIHPSFGNELKLMFLTKFVFSSLIDADRTNTRMFETGDSDDPAYDHEVMFGLYYERLLEKLDSYKKHGDANTPINLLRSEMSEQCDRFAEKPSGIYTLSIPTGGGKTLASLRYALKHAKLYGKKRIIYVVPYTTIIEQNAEEVRKILEDEAHVLEHHSNVFEDDNDDDENQDGFATMQQKIKLAKDNWDAPIIFTTMVQFLNSFYAYGSRNIRRLHNLCETVLIFDEVQKVPTFCVTLFNQALNYLKAYGKSSIVLCTATQPALDFVKQKLDMNPDAEMIGRLDQVIDAFKRVEIVDKASDETFDNAKLADFVKSVIDDVNSVLVILNTKAVVKDLYHRLNMQESAFPIYHLSTSMCAAHRNNILREVRHHLAEGNKIVCISTQLIEAGVDISFDCVIRSLAGLDSIAQAAGRCNRHGKKELQKVYIVDHVEENLNHLKEIEIGKEVARKILIDIRRIPASHGGSILSRQAMERYFKELYTAFEMDLNYSILPLRKNMMELLSSERCNNTYDRAYTSKMKERLPLFIANSYRTAAEHFRVIDDRTTTVIVPYDKGSDIIAELNGGGSIDDLSRLLKNAQQYTVSLYSHELQQLDRNGGLDRCLDGKVFVLKERAYDEEFGVNVENDSSMGVLLM